VKTYFQGLSSLNFPEWYWNQPVAGDGDGVADGDVEPCQLVPVVAVEMAFRSEADRVAVLAERRSKTEEAEAVAVLVASALVVPSVASNCPPEHSSPLRKSQKMNE
jgi:hypothetical protein